MFSVESFVCAWDNQLAYAMVLVEELTDVWGFLFWQLGIKM